MNYTFLVMVACFGALLAPVALLLAWREGERRRRELAQKTRAPRAASAVRAWDRFEVQRFVARVLVQAQSSSDIPPRNEIAPVEVEDMQRNAKALQSVLQWSTKQEHPQA